MSGKNGLQNAADRLLDYIKMVNEQEPKLNDTDFVPTSYKRFKDYGLEPTLNNMRDKDYVRTLLSLRDKIGLDILISDLSAENRSDHTQIEIEGNGRRKNSLTHLIDETTDEVTPDRKNAELRKVYIENDKVIVIGKVNFYAELSDYDEKVRFYSFDSLPYSKKNLGALILCAIYEEERNLPADSKNPYRF